MKIVKFLIKLLLWIVGIALVLVLTLPFWISPVARTAANIAVPKLTGSAFRLENFNLSADWVSLATDTIVVKDITVSGMYYEHKLDKISLPGVSLSGKGDSKAESAPKAEGASKSEPAPKAESTQSPKSQKKIIIDHLLLENIVVAIGGISVPVPKIELTGIGRKSGGVTLDEAWTQITGSIIGAASAINKHVGKAAEAVKAVSELGKIGVDNITPKGVDKAANAIKGLFK